MVWQRHTSHQLKKITAQKKKQKKVLLKKPYRNAGCVIINNTFHPAQSEKIFPSCYNKINNHTDKSKRCYKQTERGSSQMSILNGGNEETNLTLAH